MPLCQSKGNWLRTCILGEIYQSITVKVLLTLNMKHSVTTLSCPRLTDYHWELRLWRFYEHDWFFYFGNTGQVLLLLKERDQRFNYLLSCLTKNILRKKKQKKRLYNNLYHQYTSNSRKNTFNTHSYTWNTHLKHIQTHNKQLAKHAYALTKPIDGQYEISTYEFRLIDYPALGIISNRSCYNINKCKN